MPNSISEDLAIEKEIVTKTKKRFCFFHSALFPLFTFFVYAGFFYLLFNGDIRVPDMSNNEIVGIFQKYGVYAGLIIAFLSMLIMYVLYGIKKLVRLGKLGIINPIILALSFLPWYLFANQLVYHEKRYTDIARGLISFLGEPMLDATYLIFILSLLWLFAEAGIMIYKKIKPNKNTVSGILTFFILIFSPLAFTGCTGDIIGLVCDFFPDGDHCYQNAAVQEGQVEECEKIEGERFKKGGSNPPRDKCYLQIAENTGDLDACNQIRGGLMSYTKEECILNSSIKHENLAGCKMLNGEDKAQCFSQLGPKMTPDKVLAIDEQIRVLQVELKKGEDSNLDAQLKGLQEKRGDILGIMSSENKASYERQSDPMNQEIIGDFAIGEIDSGTKNKLIDLNEKLKAKGSKLTKEQYDSFKDYYKFINDPANDIEQMDDSMIVKNRWNEKLGNAVDKLKFWNSNNTAKENQLDEQLRFYQRMLERQAAINAGLSELQEDFDRNADIVAGTAIDKAKDETKDAVIEKIFGSAAGNASKITTAVLGEALDTVKAEAKSAEFRGLVNAYDKGMQEEMGRAGGNVDKAHAEVVKKLLADPYAYAEGNSFAKYGNLIENKDCDGSNPHCLNKEVFWKAMKKSYKYQNQ